MKNAFMKAFSYMIAAVFAISLASCGKMKDANSASDTQGALGRA